MDDVDDDDVVALLVFSPLPLPSPPSLRPAFAASEETSLSSFSPSSRGRFCC